jgi:hypothetical protein
MTPSSSQLAALVRLRWTMIRSRPLRVGLVLLATLPVLLTLSGVLLSGFVPQQLALTLAVSAPTLYLAFVVLAVLAPLAAGGGNVLYPADQLVAYPTRAHTQFLAALALVPANLAWMLNVVAVIVVTCLAAGPLSGFTVFPVATSLVYVACVTLLGQATAWLVIGLRQRRAGRVGTWFLAALLGVSVLYAARAGLTVPVLNRSPTTLALSSASDGYRGDWLTWWFGICALVMGSVLAFHAGSRLSAWALRRPGDQHRLTSASRVARRRPAASPLAELIAVDRASVWRAPPLRRGLIVLLLLPGAVAAAAALSWQSLVLLPGLVAAGAGLVFGINVFALDSSGALWLSTLPGWMRPAFVAKAYVTAETTLLAVGVALISGSLRAPTPSSVAQVTATVGCGLACAALVVASAQRSSVVHPHRADLLGNRDTPAPPGATVVYSVKLAAMTTCTGLLFSGVSLTDLWWAPLLLVLPFVAWAGLSLADTWRLWQQPSTRARVVTTVSGG